jgi:hypothetical protein
MMVLKEAEPWTLSVLSGTPALMIFVQVVVVGRRDCWDGVTASPGVSRGRSSSRRSSRRSAGLPPGGHGGAAEVSPEGLAVVVLLVLSR